MSPAANLPSDLVSAVVESLERGVADHRSLYARCRDLFRWHWREGVAQFSRCHRLAATGQVSGAALDYGLGAPGWILDSRQRGPQFSMLSKVLHDPSYVRGDGCPHFTEVGANITASLQEPPREYGCSEPYEGERPRQPMPESYEPGSAGPQQAAGDHGRVDPLKVLAFQFGCPTEDARRSRPVFVVVRVAEAVEDSVTGHNLGRGQERR
jgi:hypothetical protein